MLPVGVYAKVFCVLQLFMGAKSLVVLKIHVLEDMNELTMHVLEMVSAYMMQNKARQGES